ncbi:MAG: hypothetical protein ABI741_12020 [Ferruginibacter sp.]
MKKAFFLLIILSYVFIGCNQGAKEEKATTTVDSTQIVRNEPLAVDWTKHASVSGEQVAEMAAHYLELIHNKPGLGIQQVNMDGEMLRALLVGTEGLKLIAAADLRTDQITMFMQFWRAGEFSYYDIDDFFNSTQRGMRGQPALCPPPSGCELPLVRSARPNIITETEADEMARNYNSIVNRNAALAIQQVTMDATLLQLLMIGTTGIKLVYAAELRTNKITVVVQFWKGDAFYYFNIRDIFTTDMRGMRGQYALCPPPDPCELP